LPTFTPGSPFAKPASSVFYQAPPSTATSPFGRASALPATLPFSTLPQSAQDSVSNATTVFGPSGVVAHQTQAPRSAFIPPQPNVSMQGVSFSALARQGEHTLAAGLRPKHHPRWQSPGPALIPPPIRSAPDVPRYRVPPSIQREIDQGKYATDTRFPGNRFLEVRCRCSASLPLTDAMYPAAKIAPPVDARTLDQAQAYLRPGASHGPYRCYHGRRHLYGYVPGIRTA